MLRHPCILRDPQQRGAKSEVVPNKGEENQKWLPHPYLLGAQRRAEMLRRPYILGDPQKGVQKGPSPGQWKKAPHGGPR